MEVFVKYKILDSHYIHSHYIIVIAVNYDLEVADVSGM